MNVRLSSPSVERNREPILAALRPHMPASGLVLEVASGSGEHAAYLAAAFPGLQFQPSDPDPGARASVDAWCAGHPNVLPALDLDAGLPDWPIERAEAVVCVNMIHIAPWAATLGLVRGAAHVLPPGGLLALYGPFLRGGVHTASSNAEFDAGLRARNPAWGVRGLEDVAALADAAGFGPAHVTSLPANNLLVAFRRSGAPR